MKIHLILTLSALVACAGGASGQILTGAQLNFESSISGYSGTGAFGETMVPLSIYNGIPNPATVYPLGDGVGLSLTAPGALNGTDDGSFLGTLYGGYAFDPTSGDVVTLTFSGLTAGVTYDIAGYAGEGSPVTFAAATSGALTGVNSNPSVLVLGSNYATLTGVANSSGDLAVTATPVEGNILRFSGIGIESVPEPSTFLLFSSIGACLLACNRTSTCNSSRLILRKH